MLKLSFPQAVSKTNIARVFKNYTPAARIHFSKGNLKTHTPSIDLPAGIFCNRNASCWQSARCYACWLHDNVQRNYLDNMQVLLSDSKKYFDSIRQFLNKTDSKFFRWHVSGEIVNADYISNMVAIAKEYKNIIFWTYTKKYLLVNDYLAQNKRLPKNLIIMFSADENLKLDNPYKLPVFTQYYLGNEKECIRIAKQKKLNANFCCGDCIRCQENKIGCPYAKKNQVIFCAIHGNRFNTYNRAVKLKGLSAIKATSKIYKEYTASDKFDHGVLKF